MKQEASPEAPARKLAATALDLGPGPLSVPSGGVARGVVTPPPSKSVSHRYLNLSLLRPAATRIGRLLAAEDIDHFLAAVEVCGRIVKRRESGVEIERASGAARSPVGGVEQAIFCGNAGTMYRFLIATLSVLPGRWLLDGTPRLRERPVGPLVSALRQLGAKIDCLDHDGYCPLSIRGGALTGGRCELDASSSSQFLSALLMAATRATGPVAIEVSGLTSEPYVDVTLDALAAFGLRGQVADCELQDRRQFEIEPKASDATRLAVSVEGDYSAAAYPAAAAALTRGRVVLEGLSPTSSQGDRGFLDLLAQIGAEVRWQDDRLVVTGTGELRALEVDLSAMPDQVPTLAAVAAFCDGVTTIRNVPHLRIKESDRLHAMAVELSKCGIEVEELADGLRVRGSIRGPGLAAATPAIIDPHDDHRIAMSLALVGLRRPGVAIATPEVVAKSYPRFWQDMLALVEGR